MALDPRLAALRFFGRGRADAPYEQLPPHVARAMFAAEVATAGPLFLGRGPTMVAVRDVYAASLSLNLRLYHPRRSHHSQRAALHSRLPLIVFFHGGGWVVGSRETHDSLARQLAHASGAAVLSVDYRLAPEHAFPAAIDDAFLATKWATEHADELDIDPSRIAVAGDSAGGNLAACVALRARDEGGLHLAAQCLIYPATNTDFTTRSYTDFATGYGLTRAGMQWYWRMYAPSEDQRRDPYAAPALARSLAGLPPATVVTAEYDVLRDEGDAYAEALYRAKNDVAHRRVSGVTHGYIMMTRLLRSARLSIDFIGERMRHAFEHVQR